MDMVDCYNSVDYQNTVKGKKLVWYEDNSKKAEKKKQETKTYIFLGPMHVFCASWVGERVVFQFSDKVAPLSFRKTDFQIFCADLEKLMRETK